MDLSTRYLGLTLAHPLMLGASPLVDDLDEVRRAEDGGASAIVMHSLFEEQVFIDDDASRQLHAHDESFAEALYFRPSRSEFRLGPEEYLEQLRRIKAAVSVPVIASLNGYSAGGWLEYARQMDQAGADALELNVYRVAAVPQISGAAIEDHTLEMVRAVKQHAKIPVTVKLSPFYTALCNFADRLVHAGADGLVLFNRFYQADIDLEELEVQPKLELSSSSELLVRLRWLAILSAQLDVSLAVSGGVHTAVDALKAVMVGADGIQLVSAVLRGGPRRFSEIRDGITRWLTEHEYDSLTQARNSMNLARCPDPAAYERANYIHTLSSYSLRSD